MSSFLNHYPRFLKIALLCQLLIASITVAAQKPNTDPLGDEKWARAYLAAGDFVTAMKEYLLLVKRDSANSEYNYNLGSCYLNTNIDKAKAWIYIERSSLDPKMDPIVFYDLGRAYQSAYKFDEAIEAFTKYKSKLNGTDPNYISANVQIEMCNRAKEMVKHPINVTFENLGARINTPFPDYNPYITKNENTLYFCSKRAGNMGNLVDYDGYYTSDLFVVENKYGSWDKCKRLPNTVNTPLIEEMAGLSPDGSMLFSYVDNLDARFQIRYSVRQGKGFQLLQAMGPNINPNNGGATAATVTRDKKTIIFAAVRDGGKGGSDLYTARALPNGGWSTPENLGSLVNTDFDEDYPQLTNNDTRLYFSSIGHGSMGGFDIYYSDWDTVNSRWREPVNVGYPVNTPDDNVQISFTSSGRYAYMSALRPEGYGNLDIYRVIFQDVKSSYTVLRGAFTSKDSMSIFDVYKQDLAKGLDTLKIKLDSSYLAIHKTADTTVARIKKTIQNIESQMKKGPEVSITVINKATNKTFGIYKPNPVTGRFAIALEAGEYAVKADCSGYQQLNADIKISDMEMPLKEINRNFVLSKLQ